MEIIKRLSAVMEAVGHVSKTERNQSQNFNFRGIDAIMNAVSPALRKHGVVVVPHVLESEYDTVTVGRNNTQMGHARVTVQYTFWAEDGTNISATVAAESMDSGDKATAKAMSVAFRTALLQALCLPTDERDPDADSYERAPVQQQTAKKKEEPEPQVVNIDDAPLAKQKLIEFSKACAKADLDHEQVADYAGIDLTKAKNSDLEKLRAAFNELKKKVTQ